MSGKTIPIKKIIFVLLIASLAGLIYAVYFTELGTPESSASDQNITLYNLTARPTVFNKSSKIPAVELDWAYASRDLLKFAINLYGLDPQMDPDNWICDPYIIVDKSVSHRLRGREAVPIYDASGKAFRMIYEYETNAGDYDSLTIDLDLTIGPCGNYSDYYETNATPEVIPDLIANYHLSFQVPVR